jgi:hypothetical protein
MALTKLLFKPGLNRDQTNYAAEGGYYECDKIRFRSGFPEKIGGWVVQTFSPYVGAARQLFSWATTDGSQLVAIGTNEKIYVVAGTNVYDITPIRATFSSPATNNCFSTTINSTTVLVKITAHGAVDGDWVTFSGVGAVGGVSAPNLNKEFKLTYIDANSFNITVAAPATSTVLPIPGGGGNTITAAFQINIGVPTTTAGYGWGTDAWGNNAWGAGSNNPIFFPARLLFFDNYNNDLIFNTAFTKITTNNDGFIYYWQYNTAFSNRAELLSSIVGAIAVPEKVQKITFSPSGHLLAISGTEYDTTAPYVGPYSPIVIRWADVDADRGPDPLNWQPTANNTAGFLYIRSGTELVTTINTRQETLIFTEVSLDSLQFLGTTEVFSVQPLSNNITIMGPNAVVETNNVVYWMGADKFYTYSGRVDTLPCTLRQYVFQDINFNITNTFFAGTNNQYNEVVWFYASSTSNTINRYVIYNYAENIWYYGQLHRTAWIDAGVTQYPIAAADGWLYNHEIGHDDGQPLGASPLPITSYIQSADVDIDDGDKFMLVRRIIPDVNFRGSASATPTVELTVGVRNFPGAANATANASNINNGRNVTSTAVIDQYTNQVFVRCRGRQLNFKISSNGLGVTWQLGLPRVDARPDGTRG